MIPETCILNNKHKLYATLRHECNASPGTDESGCQECTYYKERKKRIMEQYNAIMSPSNHNHNLLNPATGFFGLYQAHNNASASSGSFLANVNNQVRVPYFPISDDGIISVHKEEILKEEPKKSFLKKITKVIKIIFKGGTI